MNSNLAIAKPHVLSVGEVNGIAEMAKLAAFSGFLPDDPRKPRTMEQRTADAFFVMCYGIELGIAPMTALKTIHVIEGKPACSGQALLALMRRGGVQVELPNPADITDAAMVRVKRPDSDVWNTYSYTTQMAKEAGLLSGSKKNWSNFKREMLLWRAISTAARFEAPDIVGGLYTVEELSPDTTVNSDGEPMQSFAPASFEAPNEPQDDGFVAFAVDAEIQVNMEASGQGALIGDVVAQVIAVTPKTGTNGLYYDLTLGDNPRGVKSVKEFEGGQRLRDNGVDNHALELNQPYSVKLVAQIRQSKRNDKFWDLVALTGGEPLAHWSLDTDKQAAALTRILTTLCVSGITWDTLNNYCDRTPDSFASMEGLEGFIPYFVAHYRATHKEAWYTGENLATMQATLQKQLQTSAEVAADLIRRVDVTKYTTGKEAAAACVALFESELPFNPADKDISDIPF